MKIFTIQDGGTCRASKDLDGYKKYGEANNCKNGKGGGWGNDVYIILHPKSKFYFLKHLTLNVDPRNFIGFA